jgi:hypothetical protein
MVFEYFKVEISGLSLTTCLRHNNVFRLFWEHYHLNNIMNITSLY